MYPFGFSKRICILMFLAGLYVLFEAFTTPGNSSWRSFFWRLNIEPYIGFFLVFMGWRMWPKKRRGRRDDDDDQSMNR